MSLSLRARLRTLCMLALASLPCIAACEREARPVAQTLPGRPVPATPEAGAAAREPLVIFLGDSITAGFDLPVAQAFPALLEGQLRAAGTPFRLVNAGVSGDTSAGGLRRLEWLLKQKPAVVVIELGANDGLRGQPLASVEANLRAILERVRAAGVRPLLLGMRVPTSLGAEYGDGFAALYPKLAAAQRVAFVPGFLEGVGGVPELNLPDGIHPTAAGHRRLADNVRPALQRLLADSRGDAGQHPTAP